MIERKCSCEMGMHRAPLEKYIIESGAIKSSARITQRL